MENMSHSSVAPARNPKREGASTVMLASSTKHTREGEEEQGNPEGNQERKEQEKRYKGEQGVHMKTTRDTDFSRNPYQEHKGKHLVLTSISFKCSGLIQSTSVLPLLLLNPILLASKYDRLHDFWMLACLQNA
jgi:hypothetical protein